MHNSKTFAFVYTPHRFYLYCDAFAIILWPKAQTMFIHSKRRFTIENLPAQA